MPCHTRASPGGAYFSLVSLCFVRLPASPSSPASPSASLLSSPACRTDLEPCRNLGSEKQPVSSLSVVGSGCPWRSRAKLGFYRPDSDPPKIWKAVKSRHEQLPRGSRAEDTLGGLFQGPQVWHMLRTGIKSLQPFDTGSTTCPPAWGVIGGTLGEATAQPCPSPLSALQEEHC